MSENSKIEWCDHTFNPWEGCRKVSAGCANCYAEARNRRWNGGKAVNWGYGAPRRRTSAANWKKPRAWNKAAVKAGTRPRVFCASLADWLDDEVPVEWLVDLLDLIHRTPHLDWLLLTKRPVGWKQRIGHAARLIARNDLYGAKTGDLWFWLKRWTGDYGGERKPPLNVWLGVSAEDQAAWDERVTVLLDIPARVRFVSAEPLLGPIRMGGLRPDWLIVGGESGPAARPMEASWAWSLQGQCNEAGTAFFFKQWGGVNKKTAGRELDGRTWGEFPKREAMDKNIDQKHDGGRASQGGSPPPSILTPIEDHPDIPAIQALYGTPPFPRALAYPFRNEKN